MVAQHVTVSGRNMEVGESLTTHVQAQMQALSEKYFGQLVTCRIAFTKTKGHSFACNIQVSVAHDMHYAAEATFDNVHRSFALAYERMAKQLRREKRVKHEDKPNGHMKEKVFDALSTPDFDDDDDEASFDDAKISDAADAVPAMYQETSMNRDRVAEKIMIDEMLMDEVSEIGKGNAEDWVNLVWIATRVAAVLGAPPASIEMDKDAMLLMWENEDGMALVTVIYEDGMFLSSLLPESMMFTLVGICTLRELPWSIIDPPAGD